MRELPHYISATPARQEPRQTTVGELRLCCPISESGLCHTWAATVCSVAMDGQHESVRLSRAAQRRAVVLNQLLAGELTTGQAAELFGILMRQVQRLPRPIARTDLWHWCMPIPGGSSGHAGVTGFVSNMARLGEPFVFGLDDAAAFLGPLGLCLERLTPAGAYHQNRQNPIFRSLPLSRCASRGTRKLKTFG